MASLLTCVRFAPCLALWLSAACGSDAAGGREDAGPLDPDANAPPSDAGQGAPGSGTLEIEGMAPITFALVRCELNGEFFTVGASTTDSQSALAITFEGVPPVGTYQASRAYEPIEAGQCQLSLNLALTFYDSMGGGSIVHRMLGTQHQFVLEQVPLQEDLLARDDGRVLRASGLLTCDELQGE